ncbi:MAG TPA: DNA-binding protein WhiA [Synergistaceae bacterium]|nr:DNA-binding protein WhiA [Synergistaceae bacterium]
MPTPRGALSALEMWDEWVSSPFRDSAGATREIRGILDGLSPEGRGGEEVVSSSRLWIFRRLRGLWDVARLSEAAEFAQLLSIPESMKGKVLLRLPAEILALLKQRGRPGIEWLKGVWGSSGALYIPRTGYYMTFRLPSHRIGDRVEAELRQERFSYGRRAVHNRVEITIRNQEDIVTLLSRFALGKSSLMLEERAIVRSMRDRANKLVNCDASNIRKALEASSRQMEVADAVLASVEERSVPEVLKRLIETRRENPSLSLEELGRIQTPPVSKSTIQYRWKKLERMAEALSRTVRL